MAYPSQLQRRHTAPDQLYAETEDGAKVATKDIFHAAIEGDVEAIRANLDLGVDVNAMGQPSAIWGPRFEKSGHFAASPLHYAVSYGREEAVALLLSRGARTDQRSASGHTPKDYARRRNYMGILHQLEQAILRGAPVA
uniref:Ankyrin repeat protein n=2 Tax=Neobodo designis TaxID=312471 RepID=A0A7S1MER3_NEODS|mmetsp:Transcript_39124/g.120918  ORF Transcript_39124/g.120918 Transcript_39124/m.120918 type:complete len:139 (+) Transcript_39124:33-449(+)|eukprot:CAMPEP_0174831714 /NCGR_PEP_ID=MMETSP1114-20130205/3258_1 /TAXON_ID=312471 /ORGANISM="Neobodo designis, Strain CCAP 1951/1" /LENGTH=138 /DNA_ID=CAMNT_0016065549 /DNA_START=29 /DNA_END=445 /DNA_ORIENTATION=-